MSGSINPKLGLVPPPPGTEAGPTGPTGPTGPQGVAGNLTGTALPTSSVGLAPGTLWNNNGFICIA